MNYAILHTIYKSFVAILERKKLGVIPLANSANVLEICSFHFAFADALGLLFCNDKKITIKHKNITFYPKIGGPEEDLFVCVMRMPAA